MLTKVKVGSIVSNAFHIIAQKHTTMLKNIIILIKVLFFLNYKFSMTLNF